MFIPIGVLRYEIEVEYGVVVYELEGRILRLLADGCELADETALLQLLQRFREICIVCELRSFQQLFSQQTLFRLRKGRDYCDVAAWILEQ